ncbi:FISUMP domain-containing protein [uncultured Fibrobacter sp.]|uniref:FISUMP domain-containing protein n=1 Tax=uncultured Fibrobacter sp. TaxID=261512 RepID=UPI0025FB7D6D|nr:FISUMP domain-containing protein [uncultured Fibrobacter sp.]
MKKSFQRVIATLNLFQGKQSLTIFMLAAFFALSACGDDGSSSPKGTGLPAEVADMEELETYGCGMGVIGEKVYVTELEENYECDGEKWFKSYDQTKPNSAKSSSSTRADGKGDEGGDENSPDSEKGSSSSVAPSDVEGASSSAEVDDGPGFEVKETCTEVGACDAMVKADISTWHFVRKDAFGDDAEYTYAADGKDLIITIKNADGSKNSKTYSMYNMESEVGMEMAFNAAKATCEDGGGNDVVTKTCVQDTVYSSVGIKYGSLLDERDGHTYKTVKIGDQTWMAENMKFKCEGRFWVADSEYFYTWTSALNDEKLFDEDNLPRIVRGICPEGWHVPSPADFESLLVYVGGGDSAGINLKSVDDGGSDIYGFSAKLIGYYSTWYRKIQDAGDQVNFWAADSNNAREGYAIALKIGTYFGKSVGRIGDSASDYGSPVRCLKD